jgi:hypothetical protein
MYRKKKVICQTIAKGHASKWNYDTTALVKNEKLREKYQNI